MVFGKKVMHSALLVDKNQRTREMLSRLLVQEGLSVKAAANGEEASDILKEQAFSLVISDVELPVLDGYQLLDTIRSSYREHKVILMSGGDLEKKRLLKRGALELLLKPFPNSEFVYKINMILQEKRKTKRFVSNRNVACILKGAGRGTIIEGVLNNISMDGALIETKEKIKRKSFLVIGFLTLDTRDELGLMRGRVVRAIKKGGRLPWHVAVYFDPSMHADLLEKLASNLTLEE